MLIEIISYTIFSIFAIPVIIVYGCNNDIPRAIPITEASSPVMHPSAPNPPHNPSYKSTYKSPYTCVITTQCDNTTHCDNNTTTHHYGHHYGHNWHHGGNHYGGGHHDC
jgi:hypothetical protein